jgi:hypothetical protein
VQTGQSQAMAGTPEEVPVPRKVKRMGDGMEPDRRTASRPRVLGRVAARHMIASAETGSPYLLRVWVDDDRSPAEAVMECSTSRI